MYKTSELIKRIKNSNVLENYKKEKIIEILNIIEKSKDTKNNLDLDYLSEIIFENTKLGFKLNEHKPIDFNKIKTLSIFEKIAFHSSINEINTDNFLIIGDNMDSLRNLSVCFDEESDNGIDLIYIDPPYNTRNTQSYENKFDYNDWLFEMKEKLIISRDILKSSGSIMISIDDNMHAYLKVLCDEIFGEQNFLGNFVVGLVSAQRQNKAMGKIHEYVLVYSKNISEFDEYFENSNGQYNDFIRTGSNSSIFERPKRYYPIIEKDEKIFPISTSEYEYIQNNNNENTVEQIIKRVDEIKQKYELDGFNVLLPIKDKTKKLVWQHEFNRFFSEYNKKVSIWSKEDNCFDKKPLYKYEKTKNKIVYMQEIQKPISVWLDKYTVDEFYNSAKQTTNRFEYSISSSNGKRIMNKIFTKKEIEEGYFFSSPKPVSFMKHLIKIATFNKKDALILDYFGGSGTTAQAILELNKEDQEKGINAKRRFIICTREYENFLEEGNNKYKTVKVGDICFERIYRIMFGKSSFKTNEISNWCKENKGLGGNLYKYKINDLPIDYNSDYSLDKIEKSIYEKISQKKIKDDFDLINGIFNSEAVK